MGIKEGRWTTMNEGLSISGGNVKFTADQVAVGRNAMAVKAGTLDPKKKDYDSASEMIDELVKLLSNHKDEIHNAPQMITNVSTIEKELKKDKPDATTIRVVLEELAAGVSSISKVAEAVKVLKSTILLLL